MAAATQPLNLRNIVIDYSPENFTRCTHCNTITLTYDHHEERGGTCWHTPTRFLFGTFSAWIKCPSGNTSGLNFNFYLSSLEGDEAQDEVDFEILGNNMTAVQTNYYTKGKGNNEESHDLGFNCSEAFHKYEIKWRRDVIEWVIDGRTVRRVERRRGEDFPSKPMYLYSSIWDASSIDEARWAGQYVGWNAPYECVYRDIQVPVGAAVEG